AWATDYRNTNSYSSHQKGEVMLSHLDAPATRGPATLALVPYSEPAPPAYEPIHPAERQDVQRGTVLPDQPSRQDLFDLSWRPPPAYRNLLGRRRGRLAARCLPVRTRCRPPGFRRHQRPSTMRRSLICGGSAKSMQTCSSGTIS